MKHGYSPKPSVPVSDTYQTWICVGYGWKVSVIKKKKKNVWIRRDTGWIRRDTDKSGRIESDWVELISRVESGS